jgi:hypothetical protein
MSGIVHTLGALWSYGRLQPHGALYIIGRLAQSGAL